MPYPKSPFGDDFDAELLWKLGDDDRTTVNEIQNEICEWLCRTPEITSFRVNTLKADAGELQKYIGTHVRVIVLINF
ncbi:unnamed protein product [Tenebrio molitor]|jgi:16S rRNA C967 or C1407 C5-methylase (RsmB/RsmF family)|nr:unnamed protein product [Tenebrio molitor]